MINNCFSSGQIQIGHREAAQALRSHSFHYYENRDSGQKRSDKYTT